MYPTAQRPGKRHLQRSAHLKQQRQLTSISRKINIVRFVEHHLSSIQSLESNYLIKSSIQKILKSNNWYPYKINIVQKLNEHDRILRKAFAEADLCRIQSDPSHLSYLTFSDEGHFHLDGRVNRHNSRSGLVLTFDGLVKRVSIRRALPYGLPYGKVEFTDHSFSKETCPANRTSKCSRNHFGLQLRKKE